MSPKRPIFLAATISVVLTFMLSPTAAQSDPLPDWSHAGYRGTGVLPFTYSATTSDENYVILSFELGGDSAGGSHWQHLALDGTPIDSWTGQETAAVDTHPNAGINTNCTSDTPSLVNGSIDCAP